MWIRRRWCLRSRSRSRCRRAARPPAVDPGNPILTVDPSPDTTQRTNQQDDDMDPNALPDAGTPQPIPGTLQANPTTPNGVQTPTNATNPTTPAIDPLTGQPLPTQVAPDATGRLRVVTPVGAPVQPVQPQTPSGITSSVAQAPQLATTPNPRSALDDPLADQQATAYDQVGVRVGSFIWRPAIEVSAGATSNIQSAPSGTGSSALRLAPEADRAIRLVATSTWHRTSR